MSIILISVLYDDGFCEFALISVCVHMVSYGLLRGILGV